MLKNKPVTSFVLLLLFFVIPFGIASYLYKHDVNIFGKTTNKGMLMQPLLEIKNLPLQTWDGKSFDVNKWQKHWTLLYVTGHPFDKDREQKLYYLRQVRTATGKYQDQIMRAYVSVGASARPNGKALAAVQKNYAGTNFLQTSHDAVVKFLGNESLSNVTLEQGVVYFVDPQGYVMMRYPVKVDPEDMYKDLDHLLHINNS